jgi:hypothetical protein
MAKKATKKPNKKAKKTVKNKKAGPKRKQITAKSTAKKKVAKTKVKRRSAAKTSRSAVKASNSKSKSAASRNRQTKAPHPGMMGDGTEEQNLNQMGNPEARITQDDIDEAFKKPD